MEHMKRYAKSLAQGNSTNGEVNYPANFPQPNQTQTIIKGL